MNLPSSLSRKAIAQAFHRLTPVAWEKLFEREEQNGLARIRVEGDYPGRAYYSTDGIMQWLVRNGHYTVDDFENNGERRAVGISSVFTRIVEQAR